MWNETNTSPASDTAVALPHSSTVWRCIFPSQVARHHAEHRSFPWASEAGHEISGLPIVDCPQGPCRLRAFLNASSCRAHPVSYIALRRTMEEFSSDMFPIPNCATLPPIPASVFRGNHTFFTSRSAVEGDKMSHVTCGDVQAGNVACLGKGLSHMVDYSTNNLPA